MVGLFTSGVTSMQNLEVMGVIYVKFSARAARSLAMHVRNHMQNHIWEKFAGENHIQGHIHAEFDGKSSHLKFTSESHPKSHPCKIHSLPGAHPTYHISIAYIPSASSSYGEKTRSDTPIGVSRLWSKIHILFLRAYAWNDEIFSVHWESVTILK